MKHNIVLATLLCFFLFACSLPAEAQKRTKSRHHSTSRAYNGKSVTGTPGQYPEGSDRLLTEKDLEHLTPWGMKVMQNEIYARHGLVFKDASLKKHFRKEKWYKGKQRSMKNIRLTDTESQNIAFINQHQQKAKL